MLQDLTRRLAKWVTATDAGELSRELRHGSGEFIEKRRQVAALSLVSIGSMALISLYQMGIIRHLPEPPLPRLNADKVDAAADAYELLAMPDAVLGLSSYATTLMLAAAGGTNREATAPWLPLALAGKAVIDASQAARLTWEQWAKHRVFCSWCLFAAGATFATVPLVIPEARAALQQLLEQS